MLQPHQPQQYPKHKASHSIRGCLTTYGNRLYLQHEPRFF